MTIGMNSKGSSIGELDLLVKQVSGATVKFSNDKILKASGFLRDALMLYKRGELAKQEDFNSLLGLLETIKSDKSSIPFLPMMEVLTALIPSFAVNLLPASSRQEHLDSCKESTQYYLNRIIKSAKENGDESRLEWANSVNGLLTAISKGASGGGSGGINKAESLNDPSNQVDDSHFKKKVENLSVQEDRTEQEMVKLVGNRWYIQKLQNVQETVIVTPESFNQTLAVEDSRKVSIKVDGKINASILDKCNQVEIQFGNVVSNLELISCARIKLYLTGHINTVVLDSCEEVQIFVGPESLNVNILTCKCSEVNLVVAAGLLNPNIVGDEAEDQMELAIPVQFSSKISSNGKLVTEAVDHIGA